MKQQAPLRQSRPTRQLLVLCGVLLSCEPTNFDTLDGVTVVAVEVEPPSAQPGDTVELEMTLFDPHRYRTGAPEPVSDAGSPTQESRIQEAGATDAGVGAPSPSGSALPPVPGVNSPDVQIAWFGGCHNPPGESALGCLPQIAELADQALELIGGGSLEDVPPNILENIGFGRHFRMRVPSGSVADRARAANLLPFGVSYAWFAACRGTLSLDTSKRTSDDEKLPLLCLDDDGNEVDEKDLVIGFTTIFVFDQVDNENPIVTSVTLGGETVETQSCEQTDDCEDLGRNNNYRCVAGECLVSVPRCSGSCKATDLAPRVSRASSQIDPTTAAVGQTPERELLWVKYYALGGLDRTEALVAERSGAFRSGFAAEWTRPERGRRAVPLWTVVQDNRGGTTARRVDVWLE